MGSSLLDPRRKRRRTRAHSAGFRIHTGDKKRCAISLPWVAVLFGLGMVVAVGVRKGVKSSAKDVARAARMRDKSAYPLAVLLEQHDIEPQVCKQTGVLCVCVCVCPGLWSMSTYIYLCWNFQGVNKYQRSRMWVDPGVDVNVCV